jgi:hypothetical protein
MLGPDSLGTYASETYTTDSVTVTGPEWAYYEWDFPSYLYIPYDVSLLNFFCQIYSPTAHDVYLGAVNIDSIAPTFFGIDGSAPTSSVIPNIILYAEDGIRYDYIQALYDANSGISGVDVYTLSSAVGSIGLIYTSTILNPSSADPLRLEGPLDFNGDIQVNSTPTVTDTCFTSNGDMFVFINGLLVDFLATP